MSKQTAKDRRDEARAGHRVNEMRDEHKREAKRHEAEGGRKANKEERHERAMKDEDKAYPKGGRERVPEGGIKGRPLTEELGRKTRRAGEEMAGEGGGMMGDKGSGMRGPDSTPGGATGAPAAKLHRIPAGHGPE